ncbi:polyphenol oxidase family protein [Cellulosimicrobium sp. CUA-896]|uniref:polyphenol oxidase family protein n=1 Tax=Cellulosimicrobium sp. CUA-896 TaxID=1517881 RepID=UPI000966D185|nr:polyphenol oxidase family protein [Cellulosimicrobium sp. CUA-896]OLT50562.1 multicopper polyphenol oxidase [Cellulosimicrobium sp. CUA-896]
MSLAPVLEVDLGAGVRAGFTTRAGGVSPHPWDSLNLGLGVRDDAARVRENRARAAGWLGRTAHFATQVHGTGVAVVGTAGDADAGTGPADTVGEADGLVGVDGAGVGVLVADCVPVLLADVPARVVGAVHAGRRGLAAGVVPAVVRAMVRAGADPARVRAVVGPSACGACYEVPATMRDEVAATRPAAWSTTSWGTAALDLPAGVAADLAACGVGDVRRTGVCTLEDERFYSHRRAARSGTTTGRFAGLVALGP